MSDVDIWEVLFMAKVIGKSARSDAAAKDYAWRSCRSNAMPDNQDRFSMVPVEGIEPPLLAEHDFESCASTSSATRA